MGDRKLQTIKVVLHWAWDPIGVRGVEEARDEYDSYALPVLALLQGGSTDEEVGAYLTSVEAEWMGLTPDKNKNEDIAALLRELHALEH